MENLINKILEDIKNNLKIFIITFAIFISVFYAEDQMTKKNYVFLYFKYGDDST